MEAIFEFLARRPSGDQCNIVRPSVALLSILPDVLSDLTVLAPRYSCGWFDGYHTYRTDYQLSAAGTLSGAVRIDS